MSRRPVTGGYLKCALTDIAGSLPIRMNRFTKRAHPYASPREKAPPHRILHCSPVFHQERELRQLVGAKGRGAVSPKGGELPGPRDPVPSRRPHLRGQALISRIEGNAWAGKTALATHLATLLEASGCRVVRVCPSLRRRRALAASNNAPAEDAAVLYYITASPRGNPGWGRFAGATRRKPTT